MNMEDRMPITTLKNGLKVANFSSPHPFKFDTGEELPACSPERAKKLMLLTEEREEVNEGGWTDIRIQFLMSPEVERALREDPDFEAVDIVLVPFPVREAIRRCADAFPRSVWEWVAKKTRVIRSADRVTKAIYSDRFCT